MKRLPFLLVIVLSLAASIQIARADSSVSSRSMTNGNPWAVVSGSYTPNIFSNDDDCSGYDGSSVLPDFFVLDLGSSKSISSISIRGNEPGYPAVDFNVYVAATNDFTGVTPDVVYDVPTDCVTLGSATLAAVGRYVMIEFLDGTLQVNEIILTFSETSPSGTWLYQGRIDRNGVPLSGTCSMELSAYSAVSGGVLTAGPITTSIVITDGLFALPVSYAASPLYAQTAISCTDDVAYTTITPRIPLGDLAWPGTVQSLVSLYAITATNSSTATLALTALEAVTATTSGTADVALTAITSTQSITADVALTALYAISTSVAVTDHNTLTGLQGGASNQYYHLTATAYSNLSAYPALTALTAPTATVALTALSTTTSTVATTATVALSALTAVTATQSITANVAITAINAAAAVTATRSITADYAAGIKLLPSATSGVVEVAHVKTGIADNAATEVLKINTTDEASNDGGSYTVIIEASIAHPGTAASSSSSVKFWHGAFSREMISTGTGVSTAIEDIFSGTSAATAGATRDIGTVTVTVAETSEYDVRVSFQVDTTGGSATTYVLVLSVKLIYSGFTTAPVVTGL
jgi:hypothetical protein